MDCVKFIKIIFFLGFFRISFMWCSMASYYAWKIVQFFPDWNARDLLHFNLHLSLLVVRLAHVFAGGVLRRLLWCKAWSTFQPFSLFQWSLLAILTSPGPNKLCTYYLDISTFLFSSYSITSCHVLLLVSVISHFSVLSHLVFDPRTWTFFFQIWFVNNRMRLFFHMSLFFFFFLFTWTCR